MRRKKPARTLEQEDEEVLLQLFLSGYAVDMYYLRKAVHNLREERDRLLRASTVQNQVSEEANG